MTVAYCAPGNRAHAETILAGEGRQVDEVIEHPYLGGLSGVLVFDPDGLVATPTATYTWTPRDQPVP